MPLRIFLRKPLSIAATALVTAAASVGGVLSATATAAPASPGPAAAAAAAGTPIPAHVFAPYFEAYNGDSLSGLSQQSGAKYLTMAFIQAPSKGSCTVDWNGDGSQPIAQSTFGSDIAAVRASGGDVIPSFGGYTADNTGSEIADSCTSVASIAAAYESVVTTYNVTRLDLDTEDNSLTNSAGIDRRNKAIKMVEDWAAANGRTVQFSYTLPSTTSGLDSGGVKVLQSAVANNARIDVVNIMAFDYYDGAKHEMANDSASAATGLVSQLGGLYPAKTSAQLWAMVGLTEMVGIDDYGSAETFTTGDAATVLSFADSKGISELSFWALQRDNGGCVGGKGSDSCSGISQSTWFFSHAFEPFTSGSGGGGGGGTLVNGTFETGSLSPWTCQSGGAIVTSPVHSGTHALKSNPTTGQTGECDQNITLLPNHSYTLKAWVQGTHAHLAVKGGATASVATSSTTWRQLSLPFTTGSSGAVTVNVRGATNSGGPVYVDDVTLQ